MASSSSSNGNMIKLKSSDGEVFEVDEAVAVQSQTVRHLIEDDCADAAIPLPNITGKLLAKVVEFLKKHAESSTNADDDIKSWDAEFAKIDVDGLFELIVAANYLDIKELMNLASQTVADMIKDKSVEEVRAIFNIENDFTPEEEEEVRKENQWAFH